MSQISLLSGINLVLRFTSIKSSNVFWKNVSPSQAVIASPEPAGLVDGTKFLYVCKGNDNLVNWDSVSGALDFSENGTPSCKMPNSELKTNAKFKILIYPPGATIWVPYSESVIEYTIVGGIAHIGITGYVCRAIHQNSLRLGVFTMWNSAPRCRVALVNAQNLENLYLTMSVFVDLIIYLLFLDDQEAPVESQIKI